jgi:FMN-binding domain
VSRLGLIIDGNIFSTNLTGLRSLKQHEYQLIFLNMTKPFVARMHAVIAIFGLALVWTLPAQAMERIYQSPEDFIAEVFPAKSQAKILWLSRDVQGDTTRILGHAPGQLRQRYWRDGSRTLWVLEEIGKEDLITAGFVVKDGRIELAKVLVYRESRGMEIRYPAFLNQLKGMYLVADHRLDRGIDAISGATLSVQAMERMLRAALYFDQLAREQQDAQTKGQTQ